MPRNNSEEERLTEDEIARRKLGPRVPRSVIFVLQACKSGSRTRAGGAKAIRAT